MVKLKPVKSKFIFVVGGVLSGVGKGVTSASLGAIFEAKGFRVTDETDQDMGNYERFLNTDLSSVNYMTTGRVYLSVIEGERSMKYGGRCVEVVPHIPEEIIRRIKTAADLHKAEITIIEDDEEIDVKDIPF